MASKTQHQVEPIDLGRPRESSTLVDLYGNPLNLSQYAHEQTDPFDDNALSDAKSFMATYAPDVGLLLLGLGSFCATVYNAINIKHAAETLAQIGAGLGLGAAQANPQYYILSAVVIGFGLVVECTFIYSWMMRGTTRHVGKMIKVNDRIFYHSIFSMGMDIFLTVSSLVFSLVDFGVYWMMSGQIYIAVRCILFMYQLKGMHPQVIAEQHGATTYAKESMDIIIDASERLDLKLLGARQARDRKRLDAGIRQQEGLKIMHSNKYRKSIYVTL